MDTDDGIGLNKRGSGVRRLILVSFFKAEAERRLETSMKRSIIYAIEEPETSQHPSNQRILIDSFKQLADEDNCQVILTTHSPGLAADLPSDSVRFICGDDPELTPSIRKGEDVFGEVADALGLTPDSRVKVLVCVEGPLDVAALGYMAYVLHRDDPSIPNLRDDPRCAFVPLGGSTLKHWVNENYLKGLRLPEAHIYDNDVPKYGEYVNEVNNRSDGSGSWAVLTTKHEIECYLHPDAIHDEFDGITVDVVDHPSEDRPAVPKAFAQAYYAAGMNTTLLRDVNAKKHLTKAFARMTAEQIRERDPSGEVEGWFRRIGKFLC